jgi:hypothetical protein
MLNYRFEAIAFVAGAAAPYGSGSTTLSLLYGAAVLGQLILVDLLII